MNSYYILYIPKTSSSTIGQLANLSDKSVLGTLMNGPSQELKTTCMQI